MSYQDSDTTGGKVRLKHSMVASQTIAAEGLVPGEVALNAADGVAYFRTAAGEVGQFPSATGFRRIVTLTQAAYDALAVKDSQTLYLVGESRALVLASLPGAPTTPDGSIGDCGGPDGCQTYLFWGAPTSDGGMPISGYRIYVDSVLLAFVPATDVSYQHSGQLGQSGQVVQVAAVNGVGEGPRTNIPVAPPE